MTKEERHLEAVRLRISGASYAEIAKQLGVNAKTVHRAIVTHVEELNSDLQENVATLTRLELERLDKMLAGVFTQATRGNLKAIDRAVRIMHRRAKLLGLDKPEKHEVAGPDGEPFKVYLDVDVDRV